MSVTGPSATSTVAADVAVPNPVDHDEPRRSVPAIALAALGIVYGDIGTSPLYAFKQCFQGLHGIPATVENVLGVLSLILWSLMLVVSVKYLLFILRADNRGEGGIIALVALLNPWRAAPWSRKRVLMLLGLFGAALLYGDGTITPAISVLSAIEGLKVAAPALESYVVPVAVVVLSCLFALQRHGTSKIGALFGPVMLLWFIVLAVLGILGLLQEPRVLVAIHPRHALLFLVENGTTGFVILGTVFLAVTGAETLYADMGHFGRRPIQLAWFAVALPALVLNYFGQGALVLADANKALHPFYGLAPKWLLYPLVLIATAATVIASQAVISGAFSLTRQAIQLGQMPRMRVLQTDKDHVGQIYIPAVNWTLMALTIALVLIFGSSNRLASAYGLAVSTDMVITTILAFFVAVRWKWNPVVAGALAMFFLVVDLAFFAANLFKFVDGGWYPLLIAAIVFSIMGVWRGGLRRLGELTHENREPLHEFLQQLSKQPPPRISGTAVFMTSSATETPALLVHHLEHNQVLHERVVLVTVFTQGAPWVPSAERVEVEQLSSGFYRVRVHYGFMQSPNVPVALRLCERFGLAVDPAKTTFFLGHEEVIATRPTSVWLQWQTRMFAFMWRNATRATAFYNIPTDRVVAIGLQVEM